ncbi:hypothetical protein HZU40_14075 [Mycolicibacterium fluoranthenivorans]|jgi:hypothetical protein|uniref:Intersectin-EH binding protein Ibp1 n=1 Tax=Mycolicibacterium fluoranthenivorans TaxID=258505 RepID=A0A7G8PLP0_9MYCO|nr:MULTISPECIES: hypothetical protein [Mycobacteriaceae]MCV7251832.1 hypothetical protein [Mycobacterium hackensackense]MCV7358907.1 hypothetical protein [Mycolicibacterium fluoranthenivorans]NIH95023.1 hypothetical protein [Mycolicibacterium fluoranthenivorans]QNJ95256.1 hypothetical protein HZU40_14075 [Mycolicibacterium fluoranthenivorans]
MPDLTKRALAAAFALAALGAPAALVILNPATAQAACSSGEEEDQFTTQCTPFMVPNSPDSSGFTTTAANPDIPEIDGIPCTGADSGACIGLSEDQIPQVTPHVTISSSP